MDLILRKNKMTLWKRNVFFGAFLEASFIDIMSCTEKLDVPRQETFPIPLNYIVVRHTQTNWTFHKSTKSTIIGRSMVNDHSLDFGLDSRDSQFCRNFHPKDMWAEGTLTKFKLRPYLPICGRKYGRTCPRTLNEKQDSNGTQKNPSKTLHAD